MLFKMVWSSRTFFIKKCNIYFHYFLFGGFLHFCMTMKRAERLRESHEKPPTVPFILLGSLTWVHENIIIIGDLSETHRRPNGNWHDWSETSRCFIRDRHVWSETNRRPTCPIGDRHAPSKTGMSVETHRRPTSLRSPNRIQHIFKYTYFYIIFCLFIWKNIKTLKRHVSLWLSIYVGLWSSMSVSDQECQYPMSLQWSISIFNGFRWSMSRSPMGLRLGISASEGTCRSPMDLQWSMSRSTIRHVGLR